MVANTNVMQACRLSKFHGNSISLRGGLITRSLRGKRRRAVSSRIFGAGVGEDVYISKAQSTHVDTVALTTR